MGRSAPTSDVSLQVPPSVGSQSANHVPGEIFLRGCAAPTAKHRHRTGSGPVFFQAMPAISPCVSAEPTASIPLGKACRQSAPRKCFPGKHAQASELPLNLLITPLTRRSNHKSRRCAQLDSLDACRALDLSHPTFLHRRHERFPAGKLSGLGSLDSPRRVRGIGQRRSLTHARRLAKFLIGFVKRPPREKPSYRSRLRERTSSFPDIHMDFSVSAQGPIATPPIVKMGAPDTLHWMCCFGHLHCPGTNRTITEPAKLFSGHMLAPRISSEANHR
jgi:hypothetical protein